MKQYKELHLTTFEDDYVSLEQIKKFVPDIETLYNPVKKNLLSMSNTPSTFIGYKFTQPIYVIMKYVTIFELITENGWRYGNTYWLNDHKVLTFVK